MSSFRPALWVQNEYPEELRELVRFCLVSDPLKRPYIDEVIHFATTGEKQHPDQRRGGRH